ncbi:hypothetical protein BKD30_13120 [Tersicoccus phoenicis]|uniref:Xanthine dehydrogenase n=1 Tax=Tersicoccus phoenicis TaxID=554083 RepID=A0A1R1L759_9MICC|nr:XdhC/CoxI family protein [Tersicoccus phoenicis]OMH23364.1 hypothetical protein BKD30_13120 [Tersicoccus phoenicis]
MLERINDLLAQVTVPADWAVATVVSVTGSVPREPGSTMFVHRDGTTIGSLSGGCVEAAVVDAALTALTTDRAELVGFGDADGTGFDVALTCGGELTVLVQPLNQLAGVLPGLRAIAERSPDGALDGALDDAISLVRALPGSTVPLPGPFLVRDGDALPTVRVPGLPERATGDLAAALRSGVTTTVPVFGPPEAGCPELGRLLVESRRSAARLLIYGANDHAAALARLARPLGWQVTVCDTRPVFATARRHPDAHDIVVQSPVDHLEAEAAAGRVDGRTAVVVLGHDPRFDLAVLDRALRLGLAYVGAMGSRTTDGRRRQDLLAGGLPAHLLASLHSPIGLDLGARTPPEVAVSVLAEIIAVTRRPDRRPAAHQLRDTTGPVHATPAFVSAAGREDRFSWT